MTEERFHADDFGCRESEMCPQGPAASPKSLSPQASLPLDPSPEEAEQMALQSALQNSKKAVAENPESAAAWYEYGDALLGLKRPEEAVPALRKAVELSPESSLFHYDLGLALYGLNQCEAARKEFAGIVANDTKLK